MRVASIDGRAAFAIAVGDGGPELRCRPCGGSALVPAGAPLVLLVHADACPMAALRGCEKPVFLRAGGRVVQVENEVRSKLA